MHHPRTFGTRMQIRLTGMASTSRAVCSRRPAVNKTILVGLVIALGACSEDKAPPTVIQTEPVARRTIVVAAEATGTVEPVNIVEVKSKASGQITQMTVETGS